MNFNLTAETSAKMFYPLSILGPHTEGPHFHQLAASSKCLKCALTIKFSKWFSCAYCVLGTVIGQRGNSLVHLRTWGRNGMHSMHFNFHQKIILIHPSISQISVFIKYIHKESLKVCAWIVNNNSALRHPKNITWIKQLFLNNVVCSKFGFASQVKVVSLKAKTDKP